MASRPNPNLAKINRSYTVDEVSQLYGVHKNTVRNWVKNGLVPCDDQKPMLILGRDLRAYLQNKRSKNKRSCKPGEMHCFRCKSPQLPAGKMVDYEPANDATGRLIGICNGCGGIINQFTSMAKLESNCGKYALTLPIALKHIVERSYPLLNCDFKK